MADLVEVQDHAYFDGSLQDNALYDFLLIRHGAAFVCNLHACIVVLLWRAVVCMKLHLDDVYHFVIT